MSDDPKVSARYREIPREEPPPHVDDAILAAARRSVKSRRRWYVPLAAAAVIVLAIAVTLHVERERPDVESTVAVVPAPAPREEPQVLQAPPATPAPAPARKAAPEQKPFVPDPKPQAAPAPASPPLADSAGQAREEYERRAADAERARAQAELELLRAEREPRRSRSAAVEPPAQRERMQESRRLPAAASAGLAAPAYQSPGQWLLGIQDLKRQGRDDEAEKQLAEFRKRYPDYRIPEPILEKFEKAR